MNAESTPCRDSPAPGPPSRFEPVIERAPLPLIEVEGPGHIVSFVNAPFCCLLKKTQAELLGKPFAEIVSGGALCVPLLDRVYETGKFATQGAPDPSEPGPAYWLYAMWPAPDEKEPAARVIIQLTKTSRFHHNQNVTAMNEALLIGGLRQHELREEAEKLNVRLQVEIAERKRAEQSLLEAQAQLLAHTSVLEETVAERTAQLRASVGELEAFAYSLVHDLRAPLRAIQGFTEIALAMSREEVGPTAAELLNRVVKATVRMDSLIQDVLSLNQVIRQPMNIAPVDVDTLVRDLVKERPELASPLAEIKIESPLMPMKGHMASLSQCLTNLLGNAVKFVELGVVPQVRVWSEERAAPAIPGDGSGVTATSPATLATQSPVVRLWIEDQGIGIAPDSRKKIFEIFQRLHGSTKYEGSGIGLAIVRKAIERMGGQVGVESEPGKGSRFWLELPKA